MRPAGHVLDTPGLECNEPPIRYSDLLLSNYIFFGRSSGMVVSDADCSAVGSGYEFRRRHGCLLICGAFTGSECSFAVEPQDQS
ncbi:hypothetical protein TNCV_4466811 [Trichonephila clavipes]|nr:hypothetical protein TNCV_4466811 [Trichonephila clavipes]